MRLIERAGSDILFRRPGTDVPVVTAETLLRAAHRVAAAMPHAAESLVLCTDRAAVAIAVLAAALRGLPSLLVPDRAPAALAALRAAHPRACVLGDPGAEDSLPVAATPEDAHGPEPSNPSLPADQLVACGLTSGSTGTPVGHPKLWGALVARSLAAGQRFGFVATPGRALVATVPPAHMYGFETTVMLPLHVPVTVWCGCPFYPADVASALAAVPEATLVTTPTHLAALLDSGVALPRFTAAISATAPLDPTLAERGEFAWGAPVLEIFGATEVGSVASRRTTEGDAWTPYPGVQVRADPDGAVFRAPGMVETAVPDRVELLDDGRFRLRGRVADLVKRGGKRASLAGLSRQLAALDGVREAAFVLPTGAAEERPWAIAVAPGRDEASLLAELRLRIDPTFLPRRVLLVPSLPRDALGKLPLAALRALCTAPSAAEPLGAFRVDPAHPCLPGHFPGRPVLPGAVLLAEIAALLAASPGEYRVTGVSQAKFPRAVQPGDTVTVSGRVQADRCDFVCRVAEAVVARGALRLGR